MSSACVRAARCAVLATLATLPATAALGQSVRLSLAEALARARAESPSVVIARARIEEVRGRLVGARVRAENNPYLDIAFGRRRTFDGRSTTDIEVGLLQTLETGGQRTARIAGAEAAIAGEVAASSETVRLALHSVATAYLRLQANVERRTLLAGLEQNATEVLSVAQRRYDAGDIAALELNLARSALVRAKASVAAADAEITASGGTLSRLLGLGAASIEPSDPLRRDWPGDLAALLAASDDRPDQASLRASIVEADADIKLGQASRRPNVGIGVRGKREGADHALVGVVAFAFPTFNGGQQLVATGSARAIRLRQELNSLRASAINEISTLHAEYQQRHGAAEALAEALPIATENVQLSQRSYEEGEISLADLLVVRADVLAVQLDYLNQLLAAAETAVARDSAAGVLQ